MKRAKQQEGSNSMDRLSELPKEILQRILYLLPQKETVRTSVLSKSWRYIWCTRPNLDFLDDTFKGNIQQFLSVVNKTLKLYRDQSLCVDEFHLCISEGDLDHKSVSVLRKWIRILVNMRVKKFCLCLNRSRNTTGGRVRLPSIAFRAESVQDLHLEGFVLDRKTIKKMVTFKHLTSLTLERVYIEDNESFQKIISCCPLIETLDVAECTGLRKIKVNDLHNLKDFKFSGVYLNDIYLVEEHCCIEIHAPSIESMKIWESNIWFDKGAEFRNLNTLYLRCVKSSLEHLSSCKLPGLKYLFISDCAGLEDIELFIDAPNIDHFSYRGDFIPSISFAATFSEWDSDINLIYRRPRRSADASSWFLKLKEMLELLRQSKISLTLNQYARINDHYVDDIIQENLNLGQNNGCDRRVVVENLNLHCHLSLMSSLLNRALSICRSRYIKDYLFDKDEGWERNECLWKILMQRQLGDQLHQSRQFWERDLEEVRMEAFNNNRKEWHPISSLSELQTCRDNNRKEWHPISLSKLKYDANKRKEWHPRSQMESLYDQIREFTCTRFALKWRRDGN